MRASEQIAAFFKVQTHRIFSLDISQFGGSALTDRSLSVPEHGKAPQSHIPLTYVPARNTVFLAIALAWAESLVASKIFIGVNAVDYSGYPDCRPEFIKSFEETANLGTKQGIEGRKISIATPLINLSKSRIIEKGMALGVDYGLTISCYQPDEQGTACGVCDSCFYRAKGFEEAGIVDPTRYVDRLW